MSFFANDVSKREHTLWVEKYRPQTLSEYVGNETVKETIQQYLQAHSFPFAKRKLTHPKIDE